MCYDACMPRDNPSPEADAKAWIRRVHAVLRQAFRRAGPGSIRRVEATMGLFDGAIRQWRKRDQLELDALFRILDELGVEPARFWVEVFGGNFDPVDLAKRPTAAPRDPVVRRAVARWQGPPPSKAAEMTEGRWRELDGLRGNDPKRAVRKLKAALKRAEPRWIPRLLGAYGSALRALARLDQAIEALHYALLIAEDHDDRGVCADLLQRLGVAYAYTGNHAFGLLFAKEAAYEYRMAGDLRGEGRSWVDQGLRYLNLDRLADAGAASKAALGCLPQDESRNRYSAHHTLALVYQHQGQIRQAAEAARCAEELAPILAEDLTAGLHTIKAELAAAAGDYGPAEQEFAAATEAYRTISPIDAALASVDLARIQVLRARLGQAEETVKSMAAFLEPLKENAVVTEAILQLVRLVLTGSELTLRVLDRLRHVLEEERAQL